MKTIYKVLALLFCVTLLCGAIFALASSAADEADEVAAFLESIEATRKQSVYEGTEFDYLTKANYGSVAASPTIEVGKAPLDISGKFGRLRSVTRNGNTFYEWVSPSDMVNGSLPGDADVVLGLFSTGKSAATVRDADYIVHEFDMATRTDFPGDINIVWEGRSGDGSSSFRARYSLARYNAATGTWNGGSSSVKVEPNQWSHITLVVQVVEDITVTTTYTKTATTETTDENGVVTTVTKVYTTTAVSLNGAEPTLTSKVVTTTKVGDAEATTDAGVACDSIIGQEGVTSSSVSTYSYGRSQGKLYWNGEFFNSFTPFVSKAHQTRQAWVNFSGIGYGYGMAHTGREAGDSVAYDNNAYTFINKGTAALDALFASNAPSNLSGLTHEVLWSPSYDFPVDVLGAATLTDAQGNVTNHAELKDAVAYAKANQLQGATITLYGREYLKVAIDYPVTIQYNGYGLLNGYDLAYGLAATEVKDGDTVTGLSVKADKASTATFHLYNVVYGTANATPVSTQEVEYASLYQTVGIGSYLADATTVYVPTGAFEVRDSEGVAVTITAVGEEHIGKTYGVYPVFEKLTSDVQNPVFYVKLKDGTYKFYATQNITSALGTTKSTFELENSNSVSVSHNNQPEGSTIVLLSNATYTGQFGGVGNFYVDLNGKLLYSNASALVISMNGSNYFFYSSQAGAEIFCQTSNSGNDMLIYCHNDRVPNRNTYFGYKDASTPSEERIAIYTHRIIYQKKGENCKAYFYNCDIYNTAAVDRLMAFDWGRGGRLVQFDYCNLYTQSPLHVTVAGSAQSTVTFNNSNIYGIGNATMCSTLETSGYSGTQTTNLNNTNVYGVALGITVNSTKAKHAIHVSGECDISFLGATGTVQGKTISYPTPKTIAGSGVMVPNAEYGKDRVLMFQHTFEAAYHQTLVVRQYATLQFYYEVKDQATAQTPLYAAFSQFFGDTLYKPEPEWTNLLHKDAQKVYVPDGVWEFYDEKGNVVEFTEIGSDQIAKTYKAYVKATEKEAAFTTFDKDGVEYRVAENDLTVYFGSKAMPSGMTVKLYKDSYISESLLPTENYLDLNGHSLYTEHKKNIVTPQASGKFYIYSSASGARICVTPTDGQGSGYFATLSNNDATLYVGYVNAETMCENTIEIFSGALVELRGSNTAAYFNNCVLVRNGVDNYGYCNFRDGGDAGRKVVFNNCDIYNDNALFYARGSAPANAATGDGYLTNCRVFATNRNAIIYGFYGDAAKYAQGVKPTVVLDNTQLYGGRLSQNQPATDVDSDATIIFKNNSTTSSLDAFTKAGEGYVLVPVTTNNSITIPGVKCPKYGRYGNDEVVSFPGTYTYAYKAVPVSQYLSTIYQNVSLDSNINANTYIPVWDYITSAKLVDSDVELLNRENIVNIAKGQYYQITLSEAPKDAWDTQTLELTFKNGNTVTFEVSLGRYAQRLLSLQSEDAYTVDSQEMMRYVLKYIKEVAVAFGGADAEDIFSGIEGIDVNVDLPFEEATDLSTAGIRDYVTAATLDLESYPGFAFAIAKDFVGTVRAQLGHYASDEKTFTADAPATGEEVLLLQNIPAYALRGTITITVTTAEGETKSAEFNLATYANYFADKPYAKAVYAYSVKASEYLRKHPEVGTLNK